MSKLNPIDEIVRFQTDRGLHLKPYSYVNESKNVLEELLEANGYDVPKEHRDRVLDPIVNFMRGRVGVGFVKWKQATSAMKVDAFGDIIVFCIGAIMKLGYDPKKVLSEVAKEINSREGEMVNGKFEKFLDEESQAKWYKADFDSCKAGE